MEFLDLRIDDCVKEMSKIASNSIDCVITDLPYYKIVKNGWDNIWSSKEEYLKWIEQNIKEIKRIIKPNGSIFLFTSRQLNKNIGVLMDEYFIEQRVIIWKRKRNISTSRGKALSSGYEPILYYSDGNDPTFNNVKIPPEKHLRNRKEYTTGHLKDGISLSDVWTINALTHNSKEKVNHPTQKPVELIERIIKISTNENDTILDFTMGSGTTGVACVNTNRNFIGIEIDEEYFKIAQERILKRFEELNLKIF